MDSATLAYHYRSLGHDVALHWINYGQASAESEWGCAHGLATQFRTPLHSHEVRGLTPTSGEIPGRNAALIEAVVPHIVPPGLISLGIHAGCEYADTKPEFRDAIQGQLDERFGGMVRLDCPFIMMSKQEVAEIARALAVPLEQTFSCEEPGPMHCGNCRSCLERAAALVDAGLPLLS